MDLIDVDTMQAFVAAARRTLARLSVGGEPACEWCDQHGSCDPAN